MTTVKFINMKELNNKHFDEKVLTDTIRIYEEQYGLLVSLSFREHTQSYVAVFRK